MIKELTEKWKNGKLPLGSYHVKDASGRVFIDEYIEILCGDVERRVFRWEEVIVEVVACVPSHDQFSQMVKKVKKLEKQLKEANNLLLGFLDENICSFDHNGYCQEHSSPEPDYRCIQQQLKWYFKKYEVKNDIKIGVVHCKFEKDDCFELEVLK